MNPQITIEITEDGQFKLNVQGFPNRDLAIYALSTAIIELTVPEKQNEIVVTEAKE